MIRKKRSCRIQGSESFSPILIPCPLYLNSYGGRGKAIISRFIYNITPYLQKVTGVQEADYPDYPNVVDNIFVGDVAAALISEDYSCSVNEGYHLAWLSEDYGSVEFPDIEGCPALKALQEEGSKPYRVEAETDDEVQPKPSERQTQGRRVKHQGRYV